MKTVSPSLTVTTSDRCVGVEHKHVVIDDKGKKWLMKLQNGLLEYIAQAFVRACGLRSIEVVRYAGPPLCDDCRYYCDEGDATPVLIEWVDDARTPHDMAYDNDKVHALDEDMFRMDVLDYIICNYDRHEGNYLVTQQGNVIPIDHGYSMEGSPSLHFVDSLSTEKMRSIAVEISDTIKGMLPSLRIDPDFRAHVPAIERRVEHLVRDFDYEWQKQQEMEREREEWAARRVEAEKKLQAYIVADGGGKCSLWWCAAGGRDHGRNHPDCHAIVEKQHAPIFEVEE